jgi:hypothetical protein
MKNIQPLHLILGGCGLAILGTFLPWWSSSGKVMGTVHSESISGLNFGFGTLVLILAAAAIASLYVKVPGKTKLLATCGMGAAGLAALFALIQLIKNMGNSVSVSGPDMSASASSGFGLYITIIGAAVGTFGCFQRWKPIPVDPPSAPQPPSSPPPPQA